MFSPLVSEVSTVFVPMENIAKGGRKTKSKFSKFLMLMLVDGQVSILFRYLKLVLKEEKSGIHHSKS